jgi:hypothetical protein
MSLVQNIKDNDPVSIRQAIAKLGSLKLGPTSSPTYAGLTLTGLDASEFVFTNASKTLVSINVPLVVAYGGTGAATLTDHSLLVGSGTDAITALGAATNGQLPIGSTGADPVLAPLTGTANQITVTNGAGTITLSTPQDIHAAASPTFANLYLDNGGQSYVYGGDETGEDLILRANTIDTKDYFAAYGAAGLLLNFSTGNNISFVENDTAEYTFDATTFDAKTNDIITTGTIDASSGEVLIEDNATVEPTDKSDGYIGVAIIGGQPRLYWTVEGEMYYVEGSASAAIETGSPIGLLLVLTYNLE